jgi:hypothetical protein
MLCHAPRPRSALMCISKAWCGTAWLIAKLLFGLLLLILAPAPAFADSSSPLLAAYDDRFLAIVGGRTYFWSANNTPTRLPYRAVQVGVAPNTHYLLTADGDLLGFRNVLDKPEVLMTETTRFSSGRSGILAINKNSELWWLPDYDSSLRWVTGFAGEKQKIADDVIDAAVGDGTDYYVTKSGALFVKGKAHRGQYGDGKLTSTDRFVQTASDVAQIRAIPGHAILLRNNGDVLGTGGNIYGPIGHHGLGDKAVRWSPLISDAKSAATGWAHTVAIMPDGTLMAWGSEYGPTPKPIMQDVVAAAAGYRLTIGLKKDGSVWQWDRGKTAVLVRIKP